MAVHAGPEHVPWALAPGAGAPARPCVGPSPSALHGSATPPCRQLAWQRSGQARRLRWLIRGSPEGQQPGPRFTEPRGCGRTAHSHLCDQGRVSQPAESATGTATGPGPSSPWPWPRPVPPSAAPAPCSRGRCLGAPPPGRDRFRPRFWPRRPGCPAGPPQVPEGRTASDGSLTLARRHQARPRPAEAPSCHRAVSRPRGSSAAGDVCSAVHLGPQDPFQFVSDLKPIIIVFLYCFKNDIVFSTDFGNF